jgi:hypothetical protein
LTPPTLRDQPLKFLYLRRKGFREKRLQTLDEKNQPVPDNSFPPRETETRKKKSHTGTNFHTSLTEIWDKTFPGEDATAIRHQNGPEVTTAQIP